MLHQTRIVAPPTCSSGASPRHREGEVSAGSAGERYRTLDNDLTGSGRPVRSPQNRQQIPEKETRMGTIMEREKKDGAKSYTAV